MKSKYSVDELVKLMQEVNNKMDIHCNGIGMDSFVCDQCNVKNVMKIDEGDYNCWVAYTIYYLNKKGKLKL